MTNTPPYPRARRAALAAVLLAGTALGGFAAGHAGLAAPADGQNPPVNAQPPANAHAVPDFSDLVTHVKPAVVSITSKLNAANDDDENDDTPQAPSGRMPGFPGMPGSHFPGARPHAVEARGSGFIIDPDGTVVTNNHVVRDAREVTVTLDDGTQLPARVIGRDSRTDVAVLRVKTSKPLPYIELGDSGALRVGEWVVAMGNPFGLGGTVTAGIVSALGRDIGAGPYDQFIQIDAPINQGNSGGPLFTQDGKVVGINTAILSPTGGSVGIGFAIPANTVRTVVAQLEHDGHVTRGYIGVAAQQVNEGMSHALHLSEAGGALIAGVVSDGPAAHAGLAPGDVILSVNGTKIADPRALAVQIAAVKPGDAARLEVVRDGQKQTLTATVAEQPAETRVADAGSAEHGQRARLGVALAPISPEAREQLNLPRDTKGAVVADVQSGSPAEAAGIRSGDVILSVGTKTVASPEEAVKAIRAALGDKDGSIALRVLRDGQPVFVAVTVDSHQKANDQG
jgi:serine protease Do